MRGSVRGGASPAAAKSWPLLLSAQALLEVVHLSLGGPAIRVHISNVFGDIPLQISSVRVAINKNGPQAEGNPQGILQFNKKNGAVCSRRGRISQ